MISLHSALPFLALDLESALAHIGRGDIVNQLRDALVERWSYDENSDIAYLHLRSSRTPVGADDAGPAEAPGDTISVYDELGIVIDTDSRGRLKGMEILGGKAIIAQLDEAHGTPPARA